MGGMAIGADDKVTTIVESGAEPRFAVFIGGMRSHGEAVKRDFALVLKRLRHADPELRVVWFSYRVGALLRAGLDPVAAWNGHPIRGGEARYEAAETTDEPLATQVAGLDWLLRGILTHHPRARVDLIGFSLGGIVALDWAAQHPTGTMLRAIHRVIVVNAPVGAVTPLARVLGAPLVRGALRRRGRDFGRVLRDLLPGSPAMRRIGSVRHKVDVAGVEDTGDYVVNGTLPGLSGFGQTSLPFANIGRGAAMVWPGCSVYRADLGEAASDLFGSHARLMVDPSPAASAAHAHIAGLVTTDGPIWRRRSTRHEPLLLKGVTR